MLLALNTSTPLTTVAVATLDGALLGTGVHEDERTQTGALVPLIMDVLAQAGATPADLSTLLYVRGPGSFTGIRLGLSTLMGLMVAGRYRDQPFAQSVKGVNGLEVLLQAGAGDDAAAPMLALLDTKRGDFYAQGWGVPGYDTPQCLTSADVEAMLDQHPTMRLMGAGAAGFSHKAEVLPNLESPTAERLIAQWPQLHAQGLFVDGIEPLYCRPAYVYEQRAGL